jgi:hypothetical protein
MAVSHGIGCSVEQSRRRAETGLKLRLRLRVGQETAAEGFRAF